MVGIFLRFFREKDKTIIQRVWLLNYEKSLYEKGEIYNIGICCE